MYDISNVTVLGAGSMGHGIAEVTAMAGYEVTLQDIEEEVLRDAYEQVAWSLDKLDENGMLDEDPEAILERVSTEVDLAESVAEADLVIEAIPERLELKQRTFRDVERHAPDGTVIATNTSSLSVTDIAREVEHPELTVGLHFFNPPVKMKLVEVVYGRRTSEETAETAYAFVESIDKEPIYVLKDVRGFVVNNVLGPFTDEATWMVSKGEATIQEVDAAMVHRRGYPMGPFELADQVGIDIIHHVREETGREIAPVLEERYRRGDYGRKTGRGYYDYEEGEGPDYEPGQGEDVDTLWIEARIVNEAAKLIERDVATAEDIDLGMRLGAGFPEGPCRRADDVGLDVVLAKLRDLHERYGDERYEPAEYLRRLVEDGKTGRASGEGFYTDDER